eukprot:SAG31_NODE_43063_length_268_cov_1.846154_1_plen_71_part_10
MESQSQTLIACYDAQKIKGVPVVRRKRNHRKIPAESSRRVASGWRDTRTVVSTGHWNSWRALTYFAERVAA